MNTPSLEDLLAKVDSRYSLVVTAAKRARQIIIESDPSKDGAIGAVSTALRRFCKERPSRTATL